MYFNNVHILIYVVFSVLGVTIGFFSSYIINQINNEKKIISKDFFHNQRRPNYTYIILNSIIYILLLYKYGITNTLSKNVELIKFLILSPFLFVLFNSDFKKQILPNRILLTIFEIGLIFSFISGLININMVKDMLLGMLFGAIIFVLLKLCGKYIFEKEAIGLGDVKLIAVIGLYVGVSKILEITIASFFIALVMIIFSKIIENKKIVYIPFGASIILGTILCILIPENSIIILFIELCKFISIPILKIMK